MNSKREDKEEKELLLEREVENNNTQAVEIENIKTQEERIDEKVIKSFLLKCLLFSLLIFVFTLPLEIVIYYNYDNAFLQNAFPQIYWVIFPPTVCIFAIVFYSFHNKESLVEPNSSVAYLLFPMYTLLIYLVIIVLSFKYVKTLISLSVLLSMSISILIVLNTIPACYNKPVFKLTLAFTYCFFHLVCHLVYFKDNFVEFFITLVFFLLYFAYLNTELKSIFIDFVKNNLVNRNEPISVKVIFASLLISPLDLIVYSFK